mmetsp:Transcript_14206/g.21145  ORF Transcript_14206/g.21145 Transcript_14206/m.21145 type:complete len:81 (+) Transcript_14206:208-450(+)
MMNTYQNLRRINTSDAYVYMAQSDDVFIFVIQQEFEHCEHNQPPRYIFLSHLWRQKISVKNANVGKKERIKPTTPLMIVG